jgi:hypothetical protein
MLLRDPVQNPFSTASVNTARAAYLAATAEIPQIPAVGGPEFTLRAKTGRLSAFIPIDTHESNIRKGQPLGEAGPRNLFPHACCQTLGGYRWWQRTILMLITSAE